MPLFLHSSLHHQHWWEPVLSLPCLSSVPPLLQPFLIPGSQPRCNYLPSPSFGAPLWVLGSATSVSPAVCSPAVTVQTEPSAAQASHSGSGEGKGSTSNCRPSQQNKAAVTPELSSSTGCENLNVHWLLLIWFFRAEMHISFLSLFSTVVILPVLTDIAWFSLNNRHVCWKSAYGVVFLMHRTASTTLAAFFYLIYSLSFRTWNTVKYKRAKQQHSSEITVASVKQPPGYFWNTRSYFMWHDHRACRITAV